MSKFFSSGKHKKSKEKEAKRTPNKSLIEKQILLINDKHKEATRVLREDCLSYNSIFTSKIGNSLLYIQNNRSTFALFWEQRFSSRSKYSGIF